MGLAPFGVRWLATALGWARGRGSPCPLPPTPKRQQAAALQMNATKASARAPLAVMGIRRCIIALAVAILLPLRAVAAPDVYRDGLAAGWQDWSWGGVTRDSQAPRPCTPAPRRSRSTFTGGWSGLQLGRNDPVDTSGADVLRCWVHGGSTGGQQVAIEVGNHLAGVSTRTAFTPQAGAWTPVDVPLAPLGTTQITYMYWFNNSAGAQAAFYVDDVAFTATGNPTPTPPGPVAGPALRVDVDRRTPCDQPLHLRNELRRPGAGRRAAAAGAAAGAATPRRATTGRPTPPTTPPTGTSRTSPTTTPTRRRCPTARAAISSSSRTARTGTATAADHAADRLDAARPRPTPAASASPKYGAQQSTDPWRPDCGNGVRTNGSRDHGQRRRATPATPITPAFVQDWMRHLIGRYGAAASGGVRFYNLDNEPMLWADTHRDVHPQPTGYDELRDRTLAYAAAIKAVDAGARRHSARRRGAGPAISGRRSTPPPGGAWWNNPQDRLAHGDVPLRRVVPAADARPTSSSTAMRILDYLDLHYYPQARRRRWRRRATCATQALRLRSTRSLWDPDLHGRELDRRAQSS